MTEKEEEEEKEEGMRTGMMSRTGEHRIRRKGRLTLNRKRKRLKD